MIVFHAYPYPSISISHFFGDLWRSPLWRGRADLCGSLQGRLARGAVPCHRQPRRQQGADSGSVATAWLEMLWGGAQVGRCFLSRSYRCWYFWDACPEYVHALHWLYHVYTYTYYIYMCVFLTFEWIYKYGYWDLPFVEKIEGGRGYRWTILVGRPWVDSRCFFQTCWFWIFLSLPWRRKTGRRHQHVLQHATHAKVHVRDMARLVRQVSLTAESINPLETPPYFLAVDQPSLAMDGLAST